MRLALIVEGVSNQREDIVFASNFSEHEDKEDKANAIAMVESNFSEVDFNITSCIVTTRSKGESLPSVVRRYKKGIYSPVGERVYL